MSLSPTSESGASDSALAAYEQGWVALHQLLREGGSFSGGERYCAYSNLGDGSFADVSGPSGLDLPDDGRALARVDWDLDGDLDLVIASRQAPGVRILRNDQEAGNGWVALLLAGREQRDAIGARVTVERADGGRVSASLRAGEGYLAQSSKWLHLGLGPPGPIAAVTVRWPNGQEEAFDGVAAGGRWVLREGAGRAEPFEAPAPAELESVPAAPTPVPRRTSERVVLAARPPLPSLALLDAGGQDAGPALLAATAGAPVLYVVWASWCAPCLVELGELARRKEQLNATGVAVVALGADEPSARADAAAQLAGLGWPYPAAFTDETGLEVLDALQQASVDLRQRLPLPSSFLVDAEGRLAAIYRGPLDLGDLAVDASRLRADPEEVRASAVPFPGRWRRPAPGPDLRHLENFLAERGLAAAAREISLAAIETRQGTRAQILVEMGSVRAGQGDLAGAVANFREAAQLEPEFFEAWSYLGTALHQSAQLLPAVEAYERALLLDTRHGDTRFNLALARAALGEPEAAGHELELIRIHAPELAPQLAEQLELLSNR